MVIFRHSECLQHSFILQFKRCLRSSILYLAQCLHVELRIIDEASTAADRFIVQITIAFVTLVVDLDELDLGYEAKYLDHMSHDLVSWDCLNQLDGVVCLEVSHRACIFDFTYDSEVRHVED